MPNITLRNEQDAKLLKMESADEILSSSQNHNAHMRTIVLITACVPLIMFILPKSLFPLFRDPMLLIYTVFGVAYFFQPKLSWVTKNLRMPLWLKLTLFTVLAGWCGELFAWYGNYLEKNPEPPLLHPQLIPDLIYAIGYYAGWGCAWAAPLMFVRWSLPMVFLTVGSFGWVVEQKGALLINFFNTITTNPIGGAYWLFYIVIVYGSIISLGILPVQMGLRPRYPQISVWHYLVSVPAVWGLNWVGTHVGLYLVMLATNWLGVIPEPRSIVDHPFW